MNEDPQVPAPSPLAAPGSRPGRERSEQAGDRLIRWGTTLSVLSVTGIAAVISYGHAYELVRHYGESGTTARVLPLTVDGLVGTCSLVLLHSARRRHRPPWHAWGLLATGICATAAANIAHGISHGIPGAIIAGWPALVAVGSFELLIRLIRDSGKHPGQRTSPATGAGTTAAPEPAARTSAPPGPLPATDPALATARQHYASRITTGDLPSIRAIKRDLHVGHTRATRIYASLNGHSAPEKETI